MIRKILVPVVFSPYSEGLVQYAADLAEATGADLLVANVIHARDLEAIDKITSYGYDVDVSHYLEIVKEEREKKLQDLLQNIGLAAEKIDFTFCIGQPATELIQLVLDRGVDTVVMGVKTKDVRHIFTGSVAEKMFRKCPVTVISYRNATLRERLMKKFLRYSKDKK